ncbi:MAG: outer membrane protein assembly factor BamD [Parvularculales bacterium]
MLVTVLLFLGACASDDGDYDERPVGEIYNTAWEALKEGKLIKAAQEFDEVERQHPYSVWAGRAMIMAAYAHYKQNAYDETIIAAQRYISLFPGNEAAAYAHYLIALSHYEQISDVERDQKSTEQALVALQEIVRRYPQSEYAQDARFKIDLTFDHLAGKEMAVGREYQKKNSYVAAIGRFSNVINRYQTTSHAAEALHRLTESYMALGVLDEARAVAAVLGHNYPDSEWYQDSYNLLVEKGVSLEAFANEQSLNPSSQDRKPSASEDS